MVVTIDISPDLTPLAKWLSQFAKRAQNFKGAWPEVEKRFRAEAKAQFSGSGKSEKSGNDQWAALSPFYAAWKAKRYPNKPILTATGKLASAFTKRGGGTTVRERMAWSFAPGVRTKNGYDLAALHQTGTPAARNPMPARPPFRGGNATRGVVGDPLVEFLCGIIGPPSTKRFP